MSEQKRGKKRKGKHQKDAKKERKKQKTSVEEFEHLSKIKQLWEKARQKDPKVVSDAERTKLVNQLMDLLQDRVVDLINKHDGSRIVQTVIKHGSEKVRDRILNEFKSKGQIVKLVKQKYTKHIPMKLLKYGSKKQRELILRELYGKIPKLMGQVDAAEVIEYAYASIATNRQKNLLVSEFYGPTVALALREQETINSNVDNKNNNNNNPKSTPKPKILEVIEANPLQKDIITKNLEKVATRIVEKSLVQHSISHRIIHDYIKLIDPTATKDMVTSLLEHIVHFAHTREGSLIGAHCIAYSSVKDRKNIMKSLKEYLFKLASDAHGHIVLLKCFQTIDDTVLLKKMILLELLKSPEQITAVLKDKWARLIPLFILCPFNKRYFPLDVIEVLQTNYTVNDKNDKIPTSKKAIEVKIKELREALIPVLKTFVQDLSVKDFKELLTDPFAGVVMVEFGVLEVEGIWSEEDEVREEMRRKVRELVKDCKEEEEREKGVMSREGSGALKRLIKEGKGFGRAAAEGMKGKVMKWVVGEAGSKEGEGVWVVGMLVEAEESREILRKELGENRKQLEKVRKERKGVDKVLRNLDGEVSNGKKGGNKMQED
eukprot:TRINITY_DN14415_c0_g1_i1.p1 TRINITY_DN14415_c0_g1~~TRINITY_DN14415_c0_g1_i1.p1  ORF type:complete len:612 (-),score=230.93 TRINITY_DN14415_c0_g1_i1:208-2013(-)